MVADVLHVKLAAEAGRDIGRGIAAMRQTHRGPMMLVVQVRCCCRSELVGVHRVFVTHRADNQNCPCWS